MRGCHISLFFTIQLVIYVKKRAVSPEAFTIDSMVKATRVFFVSWHNHCQKPSLLKLKVGKSQFSFIVIFWIFNSIVFIEKNFTIICTQCYIELELCTFVSLQSSYIKSKFFHWVFLSQTNFFRLLSNKSSYCPTTRTICKCCLIIPSVPQNWKISPSISAFRFCNVMISKKQNNKVLR